MPKKKSDIKTKKVCVTFDPSTIEKMDTFISKRGIGIDRADFIRKAVFYYILYLEKEISKKKLEEFELE